MSRTDKTHPLRVRLWDGALQRVAVHHHANGVCDLPRTLTEDLAHWSRSRRRGECYWDVKWTGVGFCGCAMCTGKPFRRQDRREARHESRRTLRETLKGVRASGLTGPA